MGFDIPKLENREKIYEQAKLKNPERWSGSTRNWEPVEKVYLSVSEIFPF